MWCGENLRGLLEGTADLSLTIEAPSVHDCAVSWIKSQAPDGMFDEVSGWEDALDDLLTWTSLLVPERGSLRFIHPSFAEYLAAGPRSRTPLFDTDIWLADALSPDSRGLALFVLGRRSRREGSRLADSVVELLLDRGGTDVCIAGEVIADGIAVAGALRPKVVDRLFGTLATDNLDSGAALRVLAALAADTAVGDGLATFAADAGQPEWVRTDVAEELCDLERSRGVELLRSIREQTSDTWLRRRVLQKLCVLGAATETEREQAQYEFTVAQSGPASTGARAGEWFRQVALSAANTPTQRLSAALALSERRDDGWQPLVRSMLVDPGLSGDDRFQAARRLSAHPEGADLLRELSDTADLDLRVPVLAALAGAQDERARQLLNQVQYREGPALFDQFPQLDSWSEEVGSRSHMRRERLAGLPPRVLHFAGREEILLKVHGELPDHWVCLTGIGGVGKTAIALEYAYQYASDYDFAWWIPPRSSASYATAIAALHSRPTGGGRDLLIIDDARAPADITGLLPNDSQFDVLITSRESKWEPVAGFVVSVIQVDALSTPQSAELLRALLPRGLAVTESDRLAERLGDLPAALAQAAATMAQSGMSADDYLRRLDESTDARGERPLSVTLATLAEEWPAAATLLSCYAMFAEAPIPLDVFKPDVLNPETQLANVLNDVIALNRILRELSRLSLVRIDDRVVTVPPAVRAAVENR